MRIGIIAGTGFSTFFDRVVRAEGSPPTHERVRVDTRDGPREVEIGAVGGKGIVFLGRHGQGHTVPPHRIDHAANMEALRACGVEGVIAVHNTGGLREHVTTGALVVPDDLNALFLGPVTRFHDEAVHVDMRHPFCGTLRKALLEAAPWARDGGTYVAVPGPRLETAAEVRSLATLGHVVGMTGGAEAIAAREAGLGYASLSFVANAAAGLVEEDQDEPLAAEHIRDSLAAHGEEIAEVLWKAVGHVPADYRSPCGDRLQRARLTHRAPAELEP